MKNTFTRVSAAKVAAVLGVALVPVVCVTYAQIGSGGTVLGCVGASGIIRGVDEATGTCRAGDVALTWYTKAGADAAFAFAAHNHDQRYLTRTESDGLYLMHGGKAADADLLDGLDSSAFAPASHHHDAAYYHRSEADATFLRREDFAVPVILSAPHIEQGHRAYITVNHWNIFQTTRMRLGIAGTFDGMTVDSMTGQVGQLTEYALVVNGSPTNLSCSSTAGAPCTGDWPVVIDDNDEISVLANVTKTDVCINDGSCLGPTPIITLRFKPGS